MDFNDFTLDRLVLDQEIDFLKDTPVIRPPVTSDHVSLSSSTDKSYSSRRTCPQALFFPSKAMCQRHWTEKHLNEVIGRVPHQPWHVYLLR